MNDLVVAEKYARALFELCRPLGKDEEVEAQLEALGASLKSDASFEKFLANPALSLDSKKKLFERMYPGDGQGVHKILINFFLVLFKKNRFGLIHLISREFKRIADEAQGQAVAEIHSAVALKIEAQSAIVSRLEKIAGCKITVKSIVNPSLIGGVAVKMNNKVIDDTVSSRIFLFKKELTKMHSI